jgi:regulator of sigma E protease
VSELFGSVFWLIVALGVLVTFHEYGHYWVARRNGVKVLKFSVGFGRAIWSRTAADGTVWAIGMIPLGGYVKMLDERETDVAPEESELAFNNKTVGQRMAIVAAGPIFNLVLAVFAFWLMYMIGIPETRPIVGEVSGIAAAAGIEAQDEILAVNDRATTTWTDATLALVAPALDRDTARVEVEGLDGSRRSVVLDLASLNEDFDEGNTMEEIGMPLWRPVAVPIIETVDRDSAAAEAGLRAGDRILTIGGEDVPQWRWVPHLVGKHGAEDQAMAITVERNGRVVELEITPRAQREGLFGSKLVLGISRIPYDDETLVAIDRMYVTVNKGPVEGISAAVNKTWSLTTTTLGILGRMVTGKASMRNISGPIGIAQFANYSAKSGFSTFLFFLGFISLSLGILNLLPIPLLDGGHLLYYLIELVKGSPVSDQVQVAGQYVGLAALFGLISLGIVNDILRLVS